MTKIITEQRSPEQIKRMAQHYAKKESALEKLRQKLATIGDDALLDEYEEAEYLGKSVQWLRNMRMNCGGPPFIKIGAAVRYRVGDTKASYQRHG
jgi:hypothetical protein